MGKEACEASFLRGNQNTRMIKMQPKEFFAKVGAKREAEGQIIAKALAEKGLTEKLSKYAALNSEKSIEIAAWHLRGLWHDGEWEQALADGHVEAFLDLAIDPGRFEVISIYWNNDSSELMDLPDVVVATCGSDGMEVVGRREEIAKLREYVDEHPENYTLGSHRNAEESDFAEAVRFSKGNFPEYESVADLKRRL